MVSAIFLAATACRAQYSSKTRSISGVGSGVTVGRSSATSSFNSYSAGSASYGNLYQAPQGGGALGSSIAKVNQGSFGGRGSANPAAAFSGASAGITGSSTKNIASGALASPNLTNAPAFTPAKGGKAPVLAGAAPSATTNKPASALSESDAEAMANDSMSAENSGRAYADAFAPSHPSDSPDDTGGESITTLVPKSSQGGQYRRLMREGEAAFRKQDYNQAAQAFGTAYDLSYGSRESLLSLLHVHFATARDRYNMPALYLQRILKDVPELPLIPVHPRDFYGNAGTFVEDMIRLEEYTKSKPKDANAQFVLAYVKWREKQPAQASAALRQALEYCTNNDDLYDAIQTFWKGMVHSGAVSGRLQDVPLISEVKSTPVDTLLPADPTLSPK